MGSAIFIGDELSAAGFRLTGIETVVPEPGAAGAALDDARKRAALVIMTAELANEVPAADLEAAHAGGGADAGDHSRCPVPRRAARSRQETEKRAGDRNMTATSLIPGLQSDALAREIEQQLKDETAAIIAVAEKEARGDGSAGAQQRARSSA